MSIVITPDSLRAYCRIADVKYETLYRVGSGKITRHGGSAWQESFYQDAQLFAAVTHIVTDQCKSDAPLKELCEGHELLYAADVASRVLEQKNALSTMPDSPTQTLSLAPFTISYGTGDLQTEYSLIRKTLEGLVERVSTSSFEPRVATRDYFSRYSCQLDLALQKHLGQDHYREMKSIEWTIGTYIFKGLTPPQIVSRPNPKKQDASKQGASDDQVVDTIDNQFYTPLAYLAIPPNKVLPRERIIGDQDMIAYLERMVKCLFMYNPIVGRNPMREKKIFQNKVLLQGDPGEGKGAVSFYLINFAEQLNKRIGSDLLVTSFSIDSSFEDGKIQKLKSQFHQLTTAKRPFFIYEDEIDGLLKSDDESHQKKADLQVALEFNKFLDGQYPDNGNYFFLANLNNVRNLRGSTRRRFEVLHWKGATTKEEKATLLSYKLEDGIRAGYVHVSQTQIQKLGSLAYESGLSGADITKVCEKACSDSFRWDHLIDIKNQEQDYEQQLDAIDHNHDIVTFEKLSQALLQEVDHRETALKSSRNY
ncbi:hypothetical protein HZB02_02340 [Candidatus Woesearchaeota archaeon]|nr:hypothetical protein [Candidatus Woesearchaeota archaeon]